MSKLYVGNLAWSTDEHSLRRAFEEYGSVIEATVQKDPNTGRSRGFGFVSFASEGEATAAQNAMNDVEVDKATDKGASSGGS